MAEPRHTLVALPSAPDAPWSWLAAAATVVEQGDFEALRLACRGQNLVLVVPTEAVSLLQVDLPIKNPRELERALPFALEDRLIDDVGELHFVLAERAAGSGPRPIAVVNLALAESWVKPLRDHGLRPQAVIPDSLLLPWKDGEWSLHVASGRLLIRHGLAAGTALAPALAAVWLPRLLREQGVPEALRLWVDAPAMDGVITSFATAHGLGVHHEPWAGLLALGQGSLAEGLPLNLQQGRLREAMRGSGRIWALAAGLAALAFGVQGLGLYQRIETLEARTRELNAATETRFRAAFPEVRRVVNVRVQAEQALEGLARGQRSVEDFLGLLAQGGPALVNPGGPKLLTLDFRGGRMEVDIQAPNMPSVEACQQALKGAGLQVDLVSADNRPDGVQSRLRIRGGGA